MTVRLMLTALSMALMLGACGEIGTEAPADGETFDAPLPGLTPEELAAFLKGDEQFGFAFSSAIGLGPIFNNVSCASCHSGDGRGRELRPETTRRRRAGDPQQPAVRREPERRARQPAEQPRRVVPRAPTSPRRAEPQLERRRPSNRPSAGASDSRQSRRARPSTTRSRPSARSRPSSARRPSSGSSRPRARAPATSRSSSGRRR